MMLNFITKAQDHGRAARRAKRRLRPTVMALEGRTLLSAFTADRAADGVSARMLQWATGQANVHNEADTIVCSSLFSTRKAILARRGPSNPRSTGPILVDGFNGAGGVPKNWYQVLGVAGDVTEKPHNLTITDSLGISAGIVSTLPSSVFNPVGVVTTIQAQINGVNAKGNAIFGLIGLSANGSRTGSLAAGIDAEKNVFIVEQAPGIPQTIVPIGVDKGYKGGAIGMNFIVNAAGVEVTAPGFNSGEVLFSKDLHNFSLKTAFRHGAIPALVGASQPKETGGSASFASISVSTALGRRR